MLTGFRPQRPNFGTGIGDMVRFGGGLTVVNLSNYLLRNADNVMVGAYWGAEVLGTYERAYQLLLFPLQQVSWPLGRIMITALSRLQSDPVRYRQTYLRCDPPHAPGRGARHRLDASRPPIGSSRPCSARNGEAACRYSWCWGSPGCSSR